MPFSSSPSKVAVYRQPIVDLEHNVRAYALRMPANRVLVNTPAPQGSTGITTNVFPSMTLGCGAMAGNITSDNVGPQHLINIKRLAYVVRKPEEAFEMPLDYYAAPSNGAVAAAGAVDRNTVIAAVERYLASRGIAVAASAGASSSSASATSATRPITPPASPARPPSSPGSSRQRRRRGACTRTAAWRDPWRRLRGSRPPFRRPSGADREAMSFAQAQCPRSRRAPPWPLPAEAAV